MTDITYTWKINALFVAPQLEGQTDVVLRAAWCLHGQADSVESEMQGTEQLVFSGGAFTPFDQLTQEQVIQWVQDLLGQTKIDQTKAQIVAKIQEQLLPPIDPIYKPAPWMAA